VKKAKNCKIYFFRDYKKGVLFDTTKNKEGEKDGN